MDFNNETPANGAETNSNGLTIDEAADRIAGLLDSTDEDAATHEDDADAETLTDEEGEPSDEDGTDDGEQTSEEDSTDPDATDEDVESDDEGKAEPAATVSDDAEIDFGNGEKVKVGELKAGYLRQRDYSRKTQEVAAERAEITAVRDRTINEYHTFIATAVEVMNLEPIPTGQELQTLMDEDPGEYLRVMHKLQQRQAVVDASNVRIQQLTEERNRAAVMEHQNARREGQAKLLEMRPELKTEAGLGNRLEQFILDQGVPAEALKLETNPVLFSIALDAMRWREAEAASAAVKTAKAKIDAKPALVKAGSAGAKAPVRSDLQKAKSKLSKTGSIDDAAAVLRHLL